MSWVTTISKFAMVGSVVLMGAGCTGRKDVAIAAKDQTIENQKVLLSQEQADKDALAEQNKKLAEQNNQLAEKNGAQVAAMQAQLQAQSAQMSDLQAIMKDIDSKMVIAKPGQGVQDNSGISQHGDGSIHIIVASSVLFDSGKADLKTSSHEMLRKIASTIKSKWPNNSIRIEGHTDGTPIVQNKEKFKDNMALSIARSRAVYDYISKEGGISAKHMYTAGYGDSQKLKSPEKTAADRATNRRVEIVIMPTNVNVQKDYTSASASTTTHKAAAKK